MRLEKISLEPPPGLAAFLAEVGDGESGFGGVPGFAGGRFNLQEYLEREVAMSEGRDLPEGYVPHTTFWLVDDGGEIAGMSRLRHRLTERLLHHGGHIGYYVRRSRRGRGYGTQLLALTLEEARRLGIERALLTVNSDNEPSWRLIETNGGIMEDERLDPETNRPFRRYWIELGRA